MDGVMYRVYANVRPFLFYLLRKIAPYYEIVVFTASQDWYCWRVDVM